MKTKSIFNTSLIYFIILTLFVGIRICTALNLFSFLGEAESVVLTMVIQIGLLLLLPLFLSSKLNKKSPNQTLEDFNFRGVSWKSVLISILIGFIVFILTVAISSFFSFVLGLLGYSNAGTGGQSISTWESFALSILIVAVLPAFCEEFTHRGFLISGFKKLGLKKAILYSSLLFGLLHLNIDQFFYATIIGAVLGTVAIFSRSIIPAMIIHFINNATNVYLSFAQTKGLPGGDLMSKANAFLINGNVFLNIIFITLFLLLLVFLLMYLITILLKINATKAFQSYAEKIAVERMRKEVLGDIASETPHTVLNQKIFGNTIKVSIPYEFLGFYITPQVKLGKLDTLFVYASTFLSGLITLFTFIWGVL